MKISTFRYVLGAIALAATAHLITVNPTYGKATVHQFSGAQAQREYSPEELEKLRAKLLNVVDAVKEMTELLPANAKGVENLEKIRARFEEMSGTDLNSLRKTIDPSLVDSDRLGRARQVLADYQVSERGIAQKKSRAAQSARSGGVTLTSAGFPVASPFCGADRLGTAEIIAADVVWFAADVIRELAQDACKQEVVIAGEGGNTSLVCTAVDTLWVEAKAVDEAIHFCDDDFTGAIADTSYERLDHIHTDLENSVANDNTNTASIIANTNSKAASIISNANSNTATITSNDNANTTTITTAISNAVTSINGSSSSNLNQIRDLILHTQIESDLARDTGASPVALYETPTSSGGLLDQVRSIVVQTIANVQAAGGSVGMAQSFLTQGDAYKTSGQFKAAYDSYRKAYQMAAK